MLEQEKQTLPPLMRHEHVYVPF